MLASRQHLLNCTSQICPSLRQISQSMRSGVGYGIIDSASAVDRLSPCFQRAIAFQPMQYGIDDTLTNGDHRIGAAADGLNDLIAVHLFVLKQPEDQELGNSIHKIRIGLARCHRSRMLPRSSRYCKGKPECEARHPGQSHVVDFGLEETQRPAFSIQNPQSKIQNCAPGRSLTGNMRSPWRDAGNTAASY